MMTRLLLGELTGLTLFICTLHSSFFKKFQCSKFFDQGTAVISCLHYLFSAKHRSLPIPIMLSRSLFTSALLGSLIKFASAHFYLNHPPTIGFDDALEASAPCGSFPVDFSKDNVTDFHVGGDYIALTSIHPVATWLFRATLDQSALPSNWTSLLPTIQQQGLGDYCEPSVQVPQSFAGQKGVIGVVQDAPDGILYQVSRHATRMPAISFHQVPAVCHLMCHEDRKCS